MKQKILIIGFVWPEPKSSAAGSRMMQLIDLFQNRNFEIVFASTACNFEFSENLEKLGLQIKTIVLNESSFDEFISKLNPAFVLFDRFMVEEQFGWRVAQCCPNALRILDLEDLHFLRIARQNCVKENRKFQMDDLYCESAKREIASIIRCDLTLVISDFEMKLLQKQFKIDQRILFYLPLFAQKYNGKVPSFEDRNDFIFIGNFLHEPNWDAVKYLSKEIWPMIHEHIPQAKMKIYGAYATQKVLQLHQTKNNFLIEGRVEDVSKVLLRAKVLLAPLRFGAGIKGKLMGAMEYGLPSITTDIGREGMQFDESWNGFIENEVDAFAKAAIELFTDEEKWYVAQQNGYEIVNKKFQKGTFVDSFFDYVTSVRENLKYHRNKNFFGQILLHHTLSSTKYLSKWIEEKNKKNPEN